MPFFKSTLAKLSGVKSTDSTPPSSSSSSRHQSVSQTTNTNPRRPHPITSNSDNSTSTSSFTPPADYIRSDRLIGRQISNRDVDDPTPSQPRSAEISPHNLPLVPRHSPRPKAKTSNDYIANNLDTFTFGAAASSSSVTSLLNPLDPLSQSRDDKDSDDTSLAPDTTPRPSVVDNRHPRSHQSQILQVDSRLPFHMNYTRGRDSDSVSNHTFGTSSASASVSSLSRPSASNSRGTSRVSQRTSTTPQTSANDLTSDDDDEIGVHPLPPEPAESILRLRRGTPIDRASTIYDSDADSDCCPDEFDHGIEVDSVAHQGSDAGTFFDYNNPSREQLNVDPAGRRGSLAMPIPGASERVYYSRDYATIAARRPSKSLEDIHSFSFSQNPSSSSRHDNHPLPPAPTSVPQSEGDWRDLRKRSVQRDKELPPILTVNSSSTAVAGSSNTDSSRETSATDDFQPDWMQEYGQKGVIGFDPSEIADIVGDSSNLNGNGYRPSWYARNNSIASGRRQSGVSSIDIMHKNINGVWASRKHLEQRRVWTFVKEKESASEEDSHRRDKDKGRPSITTLFGPSRLSTSPDHSNSISGSIFDRVETRDRDKIFLKPKDKPLKDPWKGMPLDSEEFWVNGMTGKYRVTRKNALSLEPGKPPQQRLSVAYIRTPYIFNPTNTDTADGPSVTIHKHSKAEAFSLSRHYRTKPTSSGLHDAVRHNASTTGQGSKDSADGRKKGNMILLGTRKVQRAYTSTTTTRKLEHHGLLGETLSHKDAERLKREEYEKRVRRKEKERKEESERRHLKASESFGRRSGHKNESRSSGKGEARSSGKSDSKSIKSKEKEKESSSVSKKHPQADSSEDSSTGSVANAISSGDSGTLINMTAATTPDCSTASSSMGSVTSSVGSVGLSVFSYETTSSDRTARAASTMGSINQSIHGLETNSSGQTSRAADIRPAPRARKPNIHDIDDDNEDEDNDSSDERRKPQSRTTHREAYASLPAEAFENAHPGNASRSLFSFKSKPGDRAVHPINPFDSAYKPIWPTAHPRHNNTDARKGKIVEDLNESFKDVGLLPADGEVKQPSSRSGQQKRRKDPTSSRKGKHGADKNQADIFEEVPDDALYMLLPLWPGETDSKSTERYLFEPPPNPPNSRQYLLLYYKTEPVPLPLELEGSKTKSGDKKRSQDSQGNTTEVDKSILLSNFHISARVFAHRDLQGSGIRIPDVGLAVTGPLKDAYEYLPDTCIRKDDYVLGWCHSREAGIEFVSEGFDKIGLTRSIPNPRPVDPEDDDTSSTDTIPILTPIGRAVMEMAWLGALAVTSFSSNLNY